MTPSEVQGLRFLRYAFSHAFLINFLATELDAAAKCP